MIDIYKRQKINLVPIPKGSGKSLNIPGGWKRYQKEMFTGPIPEDQDFAVIAGESSDNLIILDFDECDDINIIPITDVLNKTLVARTGDGYHVYLKLKGSLPDNVHLKKDKQILEIKSQGTYVIGISSEHYDKDESGLYIKTGKTYNIISNVTNIRRLDIDGAKLIETLIEEHKWELNGNISLQDGHIQKISTSDLSKGGWGSGERYSNGFRLALRRFHQGWSHDQVLNEAFSVNQKSIPPHDEKEVERWVDDGFLQFKKNKERPNNPYFPEKQNDPTKPGQKKSHTEYADQILTEYYFATLEETKEILVYRDGCYRQGGEIIVEKKCQEVIPNCDRTTVNEVLATIQRQTYKDRSLFDAESDWLNCANVWINFKTGEQRAHSPFILSRIQFPITYDPQKKANVFTKFLEECISDEKDRYTLLEQFASCFVKSAKFGKAYMYVGQGANGKSTFLSVVQECLGIENVSHISIHSFEDNRFAKAELDSKMANIYADISNEELNSASEFKALVTGDPVLAEKKNKNPFTLRNFAKMFFSANQIPIVYDESDGFFRRFMITEWNKKFTDTTANINLKEALITEDEKSGILNLLLDYAQALEERGYFKYAQSVEALKAKWKEKSNSVQAFLDSQIVYDENLVISKSRFREAYKNFCIDNKMYPVDEIKFSKYIKANSALIDDPKPHRINGKSVRVWVGGTLRSDMPKQENLDDSKPKLL